MMKVLLGALVVVMAVQTASAASPHVRTNIRNGAFPEAFAGLKSGNKKLPKIEFVCPTNTYWNPAQADYFAKYMEQHPMGGDDNDTFTQNLDHFNPSDSRTWQQRYTVNDTYYAVGTDAPIFFFLSGEAPMEFFGFQEVQLLKWAEQYKALYLVLEHRYYGKSAPFPEYSSDNLKYLSSRQALADAANFLKWYLNTLSSPGPVIVFGCSYSGALSAWFRLLYPDIALASIAPSGPVEAQSNYTSFFGQFSDSAGPTCAAAANAASQNILTTLNAPNGSAVLAEKFNSCAPIPESDVYYFLWTLMSSVGSSDQMNNPGNWILNATCDILTGAGDPIDNFAKAFAYNNAHAAAAETIGLQASCNDFSEANFIKATQNTDPAASANRSWWWQKCTEFGYFKPGYPGTSVFFDNLPVEHIVGYCAQIFGYPNMAPNIDGTNTYYGGKNLNATNVIFTNGLLDPWHLLSITENTGPVQAVTYEAGHCGPLIQSTSTDPPSLTEARVVVDTFISNVLQTNGKKKA